MVCNISVTQNVGNSKSVGADQPTDAAFEYTTVRLSNMTGQTFQLVQSALKQENNNN